MDQRFRRNERLHLKGDFRRVFQEGRRVSTGGLTLWVVRRPPEEVENKPRLGLAIPKAYGRAVDRNRIKRLLREVFRLNKSKLPSGVDMVFAARPSLARPRYSSIEPLILKLWKLADLPLRSPNS